MASGQVVQGGHRTIIASGAEIIPACAIDHTHSNCCARAAAGRLAAIAAEEGLRVSTPDAAVLAVTVGESAVAVRSQQACAAYGVRVGCFRPPSVPRGQACLRLAGRASLTEDDFAAAARALAGVRERGELWAGFRLSLACRPVAHTVPGRLIVPGLRDRGCAATLAVHALDHLR
jgi:hypothetical protein